MSSIIVEDGTKVANANSYVPVAYADAYFLLYANADWSANSTSDKEEALMSATQSLDLLYGQEYKSMPASSTQSLLWPRFVVVINKIQIIQSGTIPEQLKKATCEVASMYFAGTDIFPVPNTDATLRSLDQKLGALQQAKTWGNPPKVERFSGFNKIDLMLKPLLNVANIPAALSL